MTFKPSFSSPATAPVQDSPCNANSTRFLASWASRVSTLRRSGPAGSWKFRRFQRRRRPNRTRVNREIFSQSKERRASPRFRLCRVGPPNRRRLGTVCAARVGSNNPRIGVTPVFPGIWGSWPIACEGKGAEVDDVTTSAIQVAGTREHLDRNWSQPRGFSSHAQLQSAKDSADEKRTDGSRRLTSVLRLRPETKNRQQKSRTTT